MEVNTLEDYWLTDMTRLMSLGFCEQSFLANTSTNRAYVLVCGCLKRKQSRFYFVWMCIDNEAFLTGIHRHMSLESTLWMSDLVHRIPWTSFAMVKLFAWLACHGFMFKGLRDYLYIRVYIFVYLFGRTWRIPVRTWEMAEPSQIKWALHMHSSSRPSSVKSIVFYGFQFCPW